MDAVMESLYGIHAQFEGDVRFVFESLTGMQELWGGEEQVLNFYSHSCPRLYELNTVAYWILEKRAHTPRLRASINQIAQVAIDLSVKRGTTSLTILKAEKRSLETLNQPFHYWSKDLNVTFETEGRVKAGVELGSRLRELRTKRGFSQTELATLVGVTPSTISQVEGNLIYPSLPALLKMAEVLLVDVSSFFRNRSEVRGRMVFPASDAVATRLQGLPDGSVNARLLIPVDIEPRAEPYLIEIPPNKTLPTHFFVHKGEELGYLLSGELEVKVQQSLHRMRAGDTIHLASEIPSEWNNPGQDTATLLWIKVR
jgi:transcriptional regulator with XRE-family HTH domain